MSEWYRRSYRRHLLDMHIDDWDEAFLSKFDPGEYVRLVKQANVQSAMVYANSHIGLCYWPTKTGRMHRGIGGRDVFGEIVAGLRREGIDVIGYYSLIFNNWLCAEHPEWQIVDAEGRAARDNPGRFGRYGTVCPNNAAYREFVEAQVGELLPSYRLDGLFYDMNFWPAVCYCASCEGRYAREVGGEMPRMIDWHDARWIGFQRKREEWIAEFANFAASLAQRLQPGISVEHNSSVYTGGWRLGANLGLVAANTYLGGDLYGGADEQSFVCKLYETLTPNRPFEFMTSRCRNLGEHTSTKPKEELEQAVSLALAHGGAFLFIDAVDPVGTMYAPVYETMGEIFGWTERYEPFLGGERVQDVAIYFSFDSKFDVAENGQKATAPGFNVPHLKSALSLTRALREQHVPFGVITKWELRGDADGHSRLGSYGAIVLPGSLVLSDAEVEALRSFVEGGGGLYTSGSVPASLRAVLGIELEEDVRGMSYMRPAADAVDLFPGVDPTYPMSVPRRQAKARALAGTEVLATTVLPYTDPNDSTRMASIHSDPPGIETEYASVTRRHVGKGTAIWAAAPIEEMAQHRRVFGALVRTLLPGGPTLESEAHPSIEITMYRQDGGRRLVGLVNLQEQMPPLAVRDVQFRVRTEGREASAVLLPETSALPARRDGAYVEVAVPEVGALAMVAVDIEE